MTDVIQLCRKWTKSAAYRKAHAMLNTLQRIARATGSHLVIRLESAV